MADHFLGALKQIERRSENNIMIFSDVLSERLETLTRSMIGKVMSDNDYLKLLELYYVKFSKEEKKDAMLFCLYRMQQIQTYKEEKKGTYRNLRNMEFSEEYDVSTKAFLERKKLYYQRFCVNQFVDFLFKITIGFVVLLCLLVLVFHFGFALSFGFLIVLWLVCVVLSYEYGIDYMYEKELNKKLKDVDSHLKDVDHSLFKQIDFRRSIQKILMKAHIG